MSFQVVVSTMHQTNHSLLKKMNIQSDCIVINQSDKNEIERFTYNGHKILWMSFTEKGIGLSRNTGLMRTTADIVEFADDDMIFVDGYVENVVSEFENNKDADAILFNINSLNPERPTRKIRKFKRINRIDALKYGCARLVVKREKIIYNNVFFSLLFGGGARYGSGEDTIFLQDLLKANLKLYESPLKIADITQESSSWFNGYTEKYYEDKGALYAAVFGRIAYLIVFFVCVKNNKSIFNIFDNLNFYWRGISSFLKNRW